MKNKFELLKPKHQNLILVFLWFITLVVFPYLVGIIPENTFIRSALSFFYLILFIFSIVISTWKVKLVNKKKREQKLISSRLEKVELQKQQDEDDLKILETKIKKEKLTKELNKLIDVKCKYCGGHIDPNNNKCVDCGASKI